jgi:myo-inositol 2-dehydrogenase/D-chiro-inositol 1-dehydrogenase
MTTRRDFLLTSAAVAGAALVNNAYAGGSDTIKIGLIGCGGRGTGAGDNCLESSENVKIVALGDVSAGNLAGARKHLTGKYKDKTDITDDRCFVGLDAYQKVIDAGVDLVILATPPGFRPMHLEAAVKAGKNIFCEKPVAVDGPGIRRVLAAAEEAKRKNLAVVAGTQRRHQTGYLQTLKHIHDGAIGDIVSARAYWNQGNIWFRNREPNMSDIQYQIHNWYHFVWMCGDHIVEQHVHNLDVINWAMNAVPVTAMGMGGRSNRKQGDANDVGQIFDHFAVEYTYPNGAVMQSYCRQIAGCAESVSEALVGTKGTCQVNDYVINGKKVLEGNDNSPYVQEHTDLIKSIRDGKPLMELKTVAESTMTAIMGRVSTYTGKVVTWDEMLNSKEDTFPKDIQWDGSHKVAPVAVPGQPRRPRPKQ